MAGPPHFRPAQGGRRRARPASSHRNRTACPAGLPGRQCGRPGAQSHFPHGLAGQHPGSARQHSGGADQYRGGADQYRGGADQYSGSDGSTWLIQASTPPPTCTASEKPASFTTARHSAERAPLLQCSTIRLSCGRRSSAAPDRNSPLGIRVAPGIETISYSFGSLTSTRKMLSPLSSMSLSSLAEIVEPAAACAASSETTPQNSS